MSLIFFTFSPSAKSTIAPSKCLSASLSLFHSFSCIFAHHAEFTRLVVIVREPFFFLSFLITFLTFLLSPFSTGPFPFLRHIFLSPAFKSVSTNTIRYGISNHSRDSSEQILFYTLKPMDCVSKNVCPKIKSCFLPVVGILQPPNLPPHNRSETDEKVCMCVCWFFLMFL